MGHVEKLPNGRSKARYRIPGGRERSKTFKRKKDADVYLARAEADISRGIWRDPSSGRITYAEWASQYLESSVHKRATTLARDHQVNDKHLAPALGGIPLASISRLDVQRLVNSMNTKLQPATVRTNYGVLRAILNAAVLADVLAQSPCVGVKLPPKSPSNVPFIDATQIMELADYMPSEYRCAVLLGGVLGLRWSEVAGLRVGRINFLRETLEVVETLSEVNGKLLIADPKSPASRRVMSVPSFLIIELSRHLKRRGRPEQGEYVFTMPEGGPLRRANFNRRYFQPAVKAAGLTGVTFHVLRHSAAGVMIDQGAHVKQIQQRLGHSSVSTTMDVYGHVLAATDGDLNRALEEAFSVSRGQTAATGTDNASAQARNPLRGLVEVMGLEPTTSTLRT